MDSDVIELFRSNEQNFSLDLGDAKLTFGKLGVNQITHPVQLMNKKGTSTVATDWISPYIAGLMIDGVQSGNAYAVSGNHGTDGGNGFPTANNMSTSIKADGVAIGDNYAGTPKQVEVTIVNEVTTKENIDLTTGVRNGVDFKEYITYVFERNHMRISKLTIEAINPIYIAWYMGLQFTREYNDNVMFTYDEAKPGIYTDSTVRRDSGTKLSAPNMTRSTLMNDNNEMLHIYMDKNYGIGYNHIANDDVIAYSGANNGKFYHHLVKSGSTLEFAAGELNSYRGGYIFAENKGTNAYVTHFIEDGVKKAFVDFRQAGTEELAHASVEEIQNAKANGVSITALTDNAYAKVVI